MNKQVCASHDASASYTLTNKCSLWIQSTAQLEGKLLCNGEMMMEIMVGCVRFEAGIHLIYMGSSITKVTAEQVLQQNTLGRLQHTCCTEAFPCHLYL